jgi:2-polyprenyl-3-methyl-5-hydroxy-6-metoxy-1,4-benzoquinol methylase
MEVPAVAAGYLIRDQERMRLAERYFKWQADLAAVAVRQRVVEVGCGLGNFTRYLLGRELVVATDVDHACTERLAARFPACGNLVIRTIDVQSEEFVSLASYRPDSVVCLNVLEHVEDDELALKHMHAVLPDGGRAVLIVPAFAALFGPIDRLLGHHRRYSRDAILRLAGATGFRVTTLHYMNSVGCLAWWANARIFRRTEQSETQIKLFDRLIVPPMRWTEALLPPPFGQSLFIVLEKTGRRTP